MADNESIRAILKLCKTFDGRDKASFREYQDNLRVILSLHHNGAAEILQGRQRPARTVIGDEPSTRDTAASLAWNRENNGLFSILFFTTEKSANITVRRFTGKTQEDGVGNGQAAWVALQEKYDGNTKEARREFHDKLHNTTMQSGDDPEDFWFVMEGYRDRLEEMGQSAPDKRYKDIILRALPAEYDKIRIASCERRDLTLSTIAPPPKVAGFGR